MANSVYRTRLQGIMVVVLVKATSSSDHECNYHDSLQVCLHFKQLYVKTSARTATC